MFSFPPTTITGDGHVFHLMLIAESPELQFVRSYQCEHCEYRLDLEATFDGYKAWGRTPNDRIRRSDWDWESVGYFGSTMNIPSCHEIRMRLALR
jgi:hypothetical protein